MFLYDIGGDFIMKRLLLLGASGSIGMQTLDVVTHHPGEFCITGISVGYNIDLLHKILEEISPSYVCVADKEAYTVLVKQYPAITFFYGDEGLRLLVATDMYDLLVNAVVGFRGLVPTLTAIQHGKDVALANKESLVAGGPLVKEALKKFDVKVYPIDSEHSAIFQCLQGSQIREVDKLIITASGGSFRDKSREELKNVSVEEALCHPNWRMGGRITIDSATMANKGFEVIEAFYLFDIPFKDIEVIIHRESVIHSMVRFKDHAMIAQLGRADMRIAIQYALSYPNRLETHNSKPFNFAEFPTLHFQKADFLRYPLLSLAYQVGQMGGNYGAIMNGADEQAVELFLQHKISFLDIENYVIAAVQNLPFIKKPNIQDLIKSDEMAREYVKKAWKGVA